MPNKLPQGWVECELKDIAEDIISGTGFPKMYQGNDAGDYPFAKVGDISKLYRSSKKIIDSAENYISEDIKNKIKGKVFPLNTIVFPKIGEALKGNYRLITKRKMLFDNNVMGIYLSNNVDILFLYYFLTTQDFGRFSVATTVPSIQKGNIEKIKINLPPLNEQKRIVEKIEEEFGKIDEGVEKLKLAQEQIKQYRQSVLKSAFEGKLVANNKNYRDNNFTKQLLKKITEEKEFLIKNKVIQKAKDINEFNIEHIKDLIPTEWQWVKLNDIAFVTKLAGFEYTKYINLEDDGEVPVIRAQNVRTYNLDESSLKYIDMKTSLMLERSALTKKCILMTFIGAGIGDTALFDKEIRYHLAPNVAKIELFNNNEYKISEEYITYYLLSTVGKMEIFKSLKATAQPSLSMGTIRDIYVPLCTLDEQKQIVKEIEKRFEVTDEVERVIAENLKKAEQLKQSILKKAFEGRLVPQDPTDQPASELLAQIKAERKK